LLSFDLYKTSTMRPLSILKQALIAGLAVAGLASCDDSTGSGGGTPAGPKARLAIINAAPRTSGLRAYAGTTLLTPTALAFMGTTGVAGAPYVGVDTGTRNLRIERDSTAVVFSGNFSLAANQNYSLFVYDTLTANTLKGVLLNDTLTPSGSSVKLRVLHLAPDAPDVDVAITGGAVLYSNVRYLGKTVPNPSQLSGFQTLAAGTYNFEVRAAGTSNVLLTVPNLTLQPGKAYTFYAKGLMSGMGQNGIGIQYVQHN
jgi:hypothetical protein